MSVQPWSKKLAEDFDLITLGAGSGGVAASRRAALHGAKVAIVEGARVGGTCVLRGCVPKKLLMYAAQFGDALREARGYGWSVGPVQFEMAHWAAAKAAETRRLEGIYRQMLDTSGVTLIEGWGRLDGPGLVRVGDRLLRAQHILIATGSSPVRDSIPGIEACATSDDLLDLSRIPDEVGIVGGGYIAVEFASMLLRLGARVSLFYRDRLPLRGFDDMLRTAAAHELQAAGVLLHPGQVPLRIAQGAAGFSLAFADGSERAFAWVLNATGRRPNSSGIGLETVGVVPGPRGGIPVDAHRHTPAPGVHAVGDVTDLKNLTPVAIFEGRALVDRLFGRAPRNVDLARMPSAVFMLPPMATVGPSEAEALAAGHALHIYEADFRPMKQAFIGGQERTRMKLLVDAADDRVLAAHMIGSDAPEIVQSLAVALSAGATKADFDRTLAVHPTAAEEFVLMREPTRSLPAAAPVA
jgi:glutathione reductase (NADPH)